MNWELPNVQAGFRKGRGTRDQTGNTYWIIDKARKLQKNIYFCLIGYTKAFDCVDHKRWEHQTTLPASWETCTGQEAIVKTRHQTIDCCLKTMIFNIGKGVCQGCILSPCLFNLNAEYIMWNAGLDETQARIKIAGRKGEISITSDMQTTPSLWQKVKKN